MISDSSFSIGELFIMGFQGRSISPETQKAIQRENISQFILFAHNYENPEQLITLTDTLQTETNQHSKLPAIVSVDQEGGRVARFRAGFSTLPSAKMIGQTHSSQIAFEIAQIQARELYAAGLQLNFAPVADINTNPHNPVIGDRSFGDDEENVTRLVTACVRGHITEKVDPCIKHFPGHGDTSIDSHLALPTVTTDLETLKNREWRPFLKAMKSGCRFLMSAHILLPHLDPDRPGTLSSTFLKTYLRDYLNYRGIIVSDDMEMQAITDHYGIDQAPVLALQAGCNLLCYRSEERTLQAIESIKKALESGQLTQEYLMESILRVREVRKTISLAKDHHSPQDRLSVIGSAQHQEALQKLLAGLA